MRRRISAYIALVDIPAIQTPLASVALGILCSSEISISRNASSLITLIFAFAGIVLVISHIMVLNDYFDVEIDKNKPARQPLAEIPRRLAGALTTIFLSLGLLFSWLASTTYFLITLALTLLSAAYSAPPIRYKERYPFSTLGEVIGAFLLFWAGYGLFAPLDVRAIVISLIPFFILVAWRLNHEINYVKFDKSTGKKTLAVVQGVHKARLLFHFCLLSIIALTMGLFFTGWFSASFLFFLVIFVSLVVARALSSRFYIVWSIAKIGLYWGFIYFLIVAAWIFYF